MCVHEAVNKRDRGGWLGGGARSGGVALTVYAEMSWRSTAEGGSP